MSTATAELIMTTTYAIIPTINGEGFLVLRNDFALMDKHGNTRVFRDAEFGPQDHHPREACCWRQAPLVDDLAQKFEHHPPNEEKARRHNKVRTALLSAAVVVDETVLPGRERSLAMTKIEEAMFWANAGIAREGV